MQQFGGTLDSSNGVSTDGHPTPHTDGMQQADKALRASLLHSSTLQRPQLGLIHRP